MLRCSLVAALRITLVAVIGMLASAGAAAAKRVNLVSGFDGTAPFFDVVAVPNSSQVVVPRGADGGGSGAGLQWIAQGDTTELRSAMPAGTAAEPGGVAVATDGSVWFTLRSPGDDEVGRVSTNRVLSISKVAGLGRCTRIASGTNADLWFACADHFSRLTTAGVLTTFNSPLASAATDLELGPDGGMWFVSGSTAGRLGPDGTFVSYLLPVPGTAIARGANGFAWVSVPGGFLRIIAATGSIDRFAVPTMSATAVAGDLIMAGDGYIWFTDATDHAVGRLTDRADVSLFDAGADPTKITLDSTGTLWFVGGGIGASAGRTVVGRAETLGPPTADAQPTVTSDGTSATISVAINPQGSSTKAWATWAPEVNAQATSQSLIVQPALVGDGVLPLAWSMTLRALVPGRSYSVWVTASNARGQWDSDRLRFTVPALPTNLIAPSTTPKPAISNLAELRPTITSVKVANGKVRVPLVCTSGGCDSTVTLMGTVRKRHSSVFASTHVSIPSGKSKTVSLRLGTAARRTVRRAGKKGFKTVLEVKGKAASHRFPLTLK